MSATSSSDETSQWTLSEVHTFITKTVHFVHELTSDKTTVRAETEDDPDEGNETVLVTRDGAGGGLRRAILRLHYDAEDTGITARCERIEGWQDDPFLRPPQPGRGTWLQLHDEADVQGFIIRRICNPLTVCVGVIHNLSTLEIMAAAYGLGDTYPSVEHSIVSGSGLRVQVRTAGELRETYLRAEGPEDRLVVEVDGRAIPLPQEVPAPASALDLVDQAHADAFGDECNKPVFFILMQMGLFDFIEDESLRGFLNHSFAEMLRPAGEEAGGVTSHPARPSSHPDTFRARSPPAHPDDE